MEENQENNEEVCGICLENIQFSIELNCGHRFCSICIQNYDNFIHQNKYVDPCLFGAPRCPCINLNSCLNRPCNNIDREIMREWEMKDPIQYREWNIEESISVNRKGYVNTMKCPMCRSKVDI